LLEEIGRSEGLNPEVRQLLRQEMQRIERAFFSEDVAETPPDLASIAQDWVQRAGHATLG
jgi:hypothetical protein